ncbi:T9SS type A sorting domain-containing protein [Crocinitomix catalasitica]|nr:T9SS type A sorting domain-containing protein [Crocinitomix catalasitica]
MKKLFIIGLCIGFTSPIQAQTWSDDVAEIIYENCAVCHNSNGIGTINLMSFADAFANKDAISTYVTANLMPPWKADSSFQHYYGERILTTFERTTILDWVSAGAPEGSAGSAPPPPVFATKILPGVPDLTIQMDAYMSKATPGDDDYICISIPSGLTADRKLRAMEVIPGNRPIVHHCLVFHDENGSYLTDTTSGNCTGPDEAEDLLGGYTPGSQPTIYPADETADWRSGMQLKAGSKIILAIHYPAGSFGEWDSTSINFYFYEEPVTGFREVSALPLISDWSFIFFPETKDTVDGWFGPLPWDYTYISALPHMHLLGDFIETYGLDGTDTIPFVRIPKWDFEWQDIYYFKYMQKLPAGASLYARAGYDNTSANPNNPNDPPIIVTAGLDTQDEMFLVYYAFMQYQAGDENFNLDSANNVFLSKQTIDEDQFGFNGLEVYPNPFEDQVTLNYLLNGNSYVSLYIYDGQGRIVNKLQRGEQTKGFQSLIWDGRDEKGNDVRTGLYFYSMMIDGQHYSGRVIKR